MQLQPQWSKDRQSVVFDGRTYTFATTEVTNQSPNYIPEWDVNQVLNQSIQNQLDECLIANCAPGVRLVSNAELLLTDTGRGVDFDTILVVGESGKRANPDTVGQHGEGEIMSTLVALRLGLTKVMASRDWLAVGRFVTRESGVTVLAIDRYVTPTPRRGTAWYYAGDGVAQAAATAYTKFGRHQGLNLVNYTALTAAFDAVGVNLPERPAKASSSLIATEQGRLYSRGQYVSDQWNLALSYNLKQTPGRDRAAFAWESVRGACAEIFSQHADADAIAAVLDFATKYGSRPAEFDFLLAPPVKAVRAGVKKLLVDNGLKKLCWSTTGPEWTAKIADASAMTGVKVMSGYYAPPDWVKDAVPNIDEVVTPKAQQSLLRPIPEPVRCAAETILACCGMVETPIEGRELTDNWDGAGDVERIILNVSHLPGWSWPRFVTIVIHEAAHVASGGSPDCTRKHADQISALSGAVMEYCADDPNLYLNARAQYCAWREANREA
jgi:hypothetical protein